MTTVANYGSYGQIVMCKTYEVGGYGPVWKIMLVAASNPGKVVGATLRVARSGQVFNQVSVRGVNGGWDVKYIYASAYYADTYMVSSGWGELDGRGAGSGFGYPERVTHIANC